MIKEDFTPIYMTLINYRLATKDVEVWINVVSSTI